MAKRSKNQEEAAFLAGDIGVDGEAVEVELDEVEVEKQKATEALMRSRTYLGREFLTWLLWRTSAGDTLISVEGEPVTALFVGRIVLRGLAGEATELVAKGAMSPYSEIVRYAIDRGLLVHAARLRVQRGEQSFEVTLDAEFLDFRSAQIPKLLTEEEDNQISERLFLSEQLSVIVEALLARFLELRATKAWREKTVPQIKEWLKDRRD
ncbi:hypothetical protein L6R52_08080 [Myxococcota bacterium]|nr:hypothetical protein [Myxococcota bacterium]